MLPFDSMLFFLVFFSSVSTMLIIKDTLPGSWTVIYIAILSRSSFYSSFDEIKHIHVSISLWTLRLACFSRQDIDVCFSSLSIFSFISRQTFFFSFEDKFPHNTTPSVELTLTGRQLNTTPLGLASVIIVYTREWSSDKIAFISFFCSCLIFFSRHLNTTELMRLNEHELSTTTMRINPTVH